MSDGDHGTLIVYPTRDGLHARCGCGTDLGKSESWEVSLLALSKHMSTGLPDGSTNE